VCVSWLKKTETGQVVEVSAVDPSISPPHHDPKAVLQPGMWKSFNTHDGHAFHVRELLKDGSLGPVVLQHMVGLIPITNRFGSQIECNPNDPDPEPIVENEVGDIGRDPEFSRTPTEFFRPCNTLDIGFRNEMGCSLNVYYTGFHQASGAPLPENATSAVTPRTCHERFKFHLGINPYPDDFMWGWDSPTKFEGTFIGHNFLFRLAKNEDVVVDSVSLSPTTVIDCPNLRKQKNEVTVTEGKAILSTIGASLEDFVAPSVMLKKSLDMAATLNTSEWTMHPRSTNSTENSNAYSAEQVVGFTGPIQSI